MNTTHGHVINGSSSHADENDNETIAISVGLLGAGIVIVLMNSIVLLRGFTKLRQEPEEWFRMLGLSTCDLFCGIVAIAMSALTFQTMSSISCKIVHILVPTLCCSQLFYLLAVFLYEDLVLRDTVKKIQHDNGIFLFVFVFVAWFMSLVLCSLPVVADTSNIENSGSCSPEMLFKQTWRQSMVFYAAIYFLPLLATNMFLIKIVVVLKKMLAKENSPYVQNIDVVPCHSRSNAGYSQEVQRRHQSDSSVQNARTSLSLKGRPNTTQVPHQHKSDHSSPIRCTQKGSSSPTVRNKRPTFKRGKEDTRLWKKLQDTVFSHNLKQGGTFAERYRQAVLANQPNTIRRPTMSDSKKSVEVQRETEKGVPLTILKRRYINLAILLVILDGVSILRLVVFVGIFNGDMDATYVKILTILSVAIGTLLNGMVYTLDVFNLNRPISALFQSVYTRIRTVFI